MKDDERVRSSKETNISGTQMEVFECMEKGSEKILLVATGAQSVKKKNRGLQQSLLHLIQCAQYREENNSRFKELVQYESGDNKKDCISKYFCCRWRLGHTKAYAIR